MRINNNLMAMNSYRQLGVTTNAGANAMEKLSSGLRINRAGDDAAGLAISEKMRGQIRGLNQASRNAQDGISLIQTAEGALNETHAILQRMRELAVQASTDTNTVVDRGEIQKEMNELIDEIDRIADQTQFNEQNLLDGSFAGKKFHIGANEGQKITLNIVAMGSGPSDIEDLTLATEEEDKKVHGVAAESVLIDEKGSQIAVQLEEDGDWYAISDVVAIEGDDASALAVRADAEALNVIGSGDDGDEAPFTIKGDEEGGLGVIALKDGGVMTHEAASGAITTIQKAIETVSAERSKLGAYQNRLEHTIKNLDTSAENLQASESRIRDVDYTEAA